MGNDGAREGKTGLTSHQDANCVDLCAKMFPNALNRPDMVTVLSSGPINDVLDQAVASLEQGLSVVVKGGGVKVPQVSGRDDIDDAMTPDYWGCRFSGGGGLGLDLHTPLEVHGERGQLS